MPRTVSGCGKKVRRWEDVVFGIASGQISVGNRTCRRHSGLGDLGGRPRGFATGRYLAESALDDDEMALLTTLPGDTPGANERERLNLWFLSDAGQTRLREALHSGHYRVEIPEEAALSVVVLLLDNDFPEQALDLVARTEAVHEPAQVHPTVRVGGPLVGGCGAAGLCHADGTVITSGVSAAPDRYDAGNAGRMEPTV